MAYVIIKMSSPPSRGGEVKIWKSPDPDYIGGSPIYEVYDYADSYKEALEVAREARAEHAAEWG